MRGRVGAAVATALIAAIIGARSSAGAAASRSLAQVVGRRDLSYDEREAWRRVLEWPEECEQSFQYPDREFGGIYFYRLSKTGYLAEIICTLGAYQGSQVFLHVEQDEAGGKIESKRLSFEVLEAAGENDQELQRKRAGEIWGTTEFEPKTRRLTVLDRFRGFGDCGVEATYEFPDAATRLVSARAKLACDGKDANQPERWPVVK